MFRGVSAECSPDLSVFLQHSVSEFVLNCSSKVFGSSGGEKEVRFKFNSRSLRTRIFLYRMLVHKCPHTHPPSTTVNNPRDRYTTFFEPFRCCSKLLSFRSAPRPSPLWRVARVHNSPAINKILFSNGSPGDCIPPCIYRRSRGWQESHTTLNVILSI